MKSMSKVFLGIALVFFLALAATAADEVTLTGSIACAKCTLHKSDATSCQDVLVVKDDAGESDYYMVKNEVFDKFGHTCKGEKPAKVTGTVAEKDGKMWLTATKIEEVKG